MSDDASGSEKKLFVDEDWKSQVEREKEEALHATQTDVSNSESGIAAEKATATVHVRAPLPPANLSFLIGTLYLQGAMALGLLPNPVSNKSEFSRDQAKHAIDLLAMLEQKTEGNRTADESAELDGVLHQLRMAYVAMSESPEAKD
jgi:hypothetical protein